MQKKFGWGRDPQVLSLKPGAGVGEVGGKKTGERQVYALEKESGREAASGSPPNLLSLGL